MNPRIQKTITEIEKTKLKISELQARLRELEAQRTDLENTEIIQTVRSLNIPLRELSSALLTCRQQTAPMSVLEPVPEQEDTYHEE